MVIVVPAGDKEDFTRVPEFYDETYDLLEIANVLWTKSLRSDTLRKRNLSAKGHGSTVTENERSRIWLIFLPRLRVTSTG